MLISIHAPRYQFLRQEMALIRKVAGLTQSELGDLLGVGQSFVSKIERGEAYVDVMLLVDWCRHCKASASALIGSVEKPEGASFP